ncbi:cytochrome P450 [Periconia macrospinosa]|uniref:Cytochrome P450 n=1 Tax=Periconia macrospinosa TaxID=97972 RepID=A0A2V1DXK0_9PLEO|nr:cytochrome P450 [Periconia macrospinosa]
MASVSSLSLVILAITALIYIVRRVLASKGNGRPLPPGPKGVPIVGNVNDLPKPGELEYKHWLKLKDEYGPISSITVMGNTFIIISDPQIALDLMRDRSNVYSSRPGMTFSNMIGWNNATALVPYTSTWKTHRKNVTKVASTNTSISMFNIVQETEAAHFLLNLLDTPNDLLEHVRTEAGSVILKITYGYTTKREKDPLVLLANATMEDFKEATVPGRWAVDVIPFLKYLPDWFPGTEFKQVARMMQEHLREATDKPYHFVKQQMRSKTAKTSFMSQSIEEFGTDPRMESIHKWSALALYLGGSDTSVSAIITFFLAMLLFPDVQKKAQEELDRVIGSDRLPVSADISRLPYIEAIMKETHRWHPILPMGIPHSSTEEDVYRGYRIPKGALLLPNIWWFTHDPTVYPDPMTFNPDRHITTPTHKAEPDPRTFTFGFGKRICPGRYVADNAIFMTIAQTLSCFNIKKPVIDGKVVEPEVRYLPGAITEPVPFKVDVAPRSKKHEELVRKSEEKYPWEESDAEELKTVKWE